MYKEDLALNNLKWLICHKTQQTKHNRKYFKQHQYPKCFKLVENISKHNNNKKNGKTAAFMIGFT